MAHVYSLTGDKISLTLSPDDIGVHFETPEVAANAFRSVAAGVQRAGRSEPQPHGPLPRGFRGAVAAPVHRADLERVRPRRRVLLPAGGAGLPVVDAGHAALEEAERRQFWARAASSGRARNGSQTRSQANRSSVQKSVRARYETGRA